VVVALVTASARWWSVSADSADQGTGTVHGTGRWRRAMTYDNFFLVFDDDLKRTALPEADAL
jgi:hypothetical protein